MNDGIDHHRRTFFMRTVKMLLAAPFVSCLKKDRRQFDPAFASAVATVDAIRSGVISSRELTAHVFERIRKYDRRVNAFITLSEDLAMESARRADEAQSAGRFLGPLHGLPVMVKDAFATEGIRSTGGFKELSGHVPEEDAAVVARLKRAGAVIVGKTSVPAASQDVQTYNSIVGTTNNPWDLSRTPGGSTGGGAAALAAGFGYLEIGSDLGGSIRTPAHFCGIYGHKTSLNVIPGDGVIHSPSAGPGPPASDLAVIGPLARDARDLKLALEVIGGPRGGERAAYVWKLPPPRHASLKDYRIGYVTADAFCPLAPDVAELVSRAVDNLRRHGVKLTEGWPEGVDPHSMYDIYNFLMGARGRLTNDELRMLRNSFDRPWGYYARLRSEGAAASHQRWVEENQSRWKVIAAWQHYFTSHDAFIMPANFVTAFPHTQSPSFFERTVDTPGGPRLYPDLLKWASIATLTGCPATVAPVGLTKGGLPVGIQIMGPFLEDGTPIEIARLAADLMGSFKPPPGFH